MANPAGLTPETGDELRLADRLDALDGEIIALLTRRAVCAHEAEQARVRSGGPRTSLAEENQVIERYGAELGKPGVTLALALLRLSRAGTAR